MNRIAHQFGVLTARHPWKTGLGMMAFLLMIGLWFSWDEPVAQTAPAAQGSHAKPVKPTASDVRDLRRGQVAHVTRLLRDSLHDPASFAVESVVLAPDNSGCYAFRAKNGFGAVRRQTVVLTPDDQLEQSTAAGFEALWRRHCEQGGESLTAYVKASVL